MNAVKQADNVQPITKGKDMSEPKLPKVTQKYIDDVFDEVSKMQIALDPDPLRFGPRRLNEKVAVTRNLLTRCEQLFNAITHSLQLYTTHQRMKQLAFDLQEKDLLANDPTVRAGRNLKSQEAVAHLKLRSELEELSRIKSTVVNLETLLAVVKTKRSDLRDVQNRLKDQMKLCQEDISIGRRWGTELEDTSKPTNLRPRTLVSPHDADNILGHDVTDDNTNDDLADLDALLADLDEN